MYECGFEDLAHRKRHHLLCMVNHMILIILTKEDQKLHSQVGTKSSSEQYRKIPNIGRPSIIGRTPTLDLVLLGLKPMAKPHYRWYPYYIINLGPT